MPTSTCFGNQHALHDQRAAQDAFGFGPHQHVVAGDEGLAFGAVDDQRVGGAALARRQLEMTREDGTAQTHHAGVAQEIPHFARTGGVPVEKFAFHRAVVAVGLDHDRRRRQAGRVRHRPRFDRHHAARGGRMHCARHIAVGRADALAAQHRVAGLTSGRGVPPMFWCSGSTSCGGSGRRAIDSRVDASCSDRV
jgi:hypothetical protein